MSARVARLLRFASNARVIPGSLPVEATRAGLVGSLPLVILAVSPQRVELSIAVAGAYLLAALVLVRPTRADAPVLIYVLAGAAFMSLTLLRAEAMSNLSAAQKDYALVKTAYFVLAVLPMSFAAALLIRQIDQIRPVAIVYIIVGITMAVLTLGLCNPQLLGEERYTWQGNLAALATILLLQFWIVRAFWLGAALGTLSLLGLSAASSRQSLVAVGVGLLATAGYWLLADYLRRARGRSFRLSRMSLLPLALVLGWVGLLAAWVYLEFLRARGLVGANWLHNPAARCGQVASRIVAISQNSGSRDELVASGWQLFVHHPLLGGGLGSFVGLVNGYKYPHNVPLEVAGEMGIVGVAILLVPLLVGWLRLLALGVRARSSAVASLMAIVAVFAVVANLSGDLASARALWIFGLMALKLGFAPADAVGSTRQSAA